MACRPVTTLFLIFFFLFTSSSASRILPSHSQKVSLGLYYESLCPYSANFIVNYLAQLFETDLISVVDLKLVPWGNAKLRGNDTFDCQVSTLPFVSFSNLLCGVFFDSANWWPLFDDDCSTAHLNAYWTLWKPVQSMPGLTW